MGIYALYRGEECLFVGTIYEIAKKYNIKIESVKYYLRPAYKRKLSKRRFGKYENQRILIKVEEE